MLIIRLIIVLLAITAMVLLGMYLLYGDRKYLQYFKKTLKFACYVLLVFGLLLVLRRFFYMI